MHHFRHYFNRICSIRTGIRSVRTLFRSVRTGQATVPTRYKGNISLLVIFVLLASALIALLAMHQIQNLMSYGATTYHYFRTHYLAKAGLEIALTETYLRDAGFEMKIGSWDSIVSGNLLTGYEGFEPYFTVDMVAQLSEQCKQIWPWESMVVPLFLDTVQGHPQSLKPPQKGEITYFDDKRIKDSKGGENKELVFGIFAFSGDSIEEMTDMVTWQWKTLQDFLGQEVVTSLIATSTTRKYLTIVNPSVSEEVSFCITSSSPLASPDTLIAVQAHYGDTEVWLEATFSEPFPNFLQGISFLETSDT